MKAYGMIAAAAVMLAAPALAEDMRMDAPGSPATQAYMQAMQTMHDAVQTMKPTNDPDKDFVLMMKPHHQAAVDMATAYLKFGSDPKLKRMARDIVSSQKKEIADMNAWEAKHGM